MEAIGQLNYEGYTEEEIFDIFADNAITSVPSEWKDNVSGAYWEEIDRIKAATKRRVGAKMKTDIELVAQSKWAKEFKVENSTDYERALELVSRDTVEVKLVHTDETGEWVWAICSIEEPEFWLDACRTKGKALSVCKEMGWKVVGNTK